MQNPDDLPVCSNCFSFNSIFNALTQSEIEQLNYEKGCNFYKRGNIIYQERNRLAGVYCVNRGIIKLYKTGLEGKEQIVKFAQKGDIIGYRSILSHELACTTAKAIEDSLLCFIPASIFMRLINENHEFSMRVLSLSLKELGEANKFILNIAQKSVRERLAEVLILLMDTFSLDEDNYLKVNLTREEIANIVGTATESVIRLLSEFKDDKYIEINKRKIKIINPEALKKLGGV